MAHQVQLTPARPNKQIFTIILAVLGWVGCMLQIYLTINRGIANGMSLFGAILLYFHYLTNWTILFTAISFTALAMSARCKLIKISTKHLVITAVTIYMTFISSAYHTLLRHVWSLEGLSAWVSELTHTIIPGLLIYFWLLYIPIIKWKVIHVLYVMVYPLSYLGIILWTGHHSGLYPYPFLNAYKLGYFYVIVNIILLLLSFMMIGGLFVLLNRYLKERWEQ